MARKALILVRTIGLKVNFEDVEIESLIPKNLNEYNKISLQKFMKRLERLEKSKRSIEGKVKNAKKQKVVLKYVATIKRKKGKSIKVGLKKFSSKSAFGRLKENERITVIKTKEHHRYEEPIIIKGLDAGHKTTVERILRDIRNIFLVEK